MWTTSQDQKILIKVLVPRHLELATAVRGIAELIRVPTNDKKTRFIGSI